MTAGLADEKGFVSMVEGSNGNISGSGGNTFTAEDEVTTSSGERNPREPEGSEFLASTGSSHTSPP